MSSMIVVLRGTYFVFAPYKNCVLLRERRSDTPSKYFFFDGLRKKSQDIHDRIFLF